MLIDREPDGFPDRLGEFLHDLLIRRRDLHIYVLTWDFHMIYWKEREWWLPSKLVAHRRLHFYKDGAHPVGASHHQKIVVIDDMPGLCGRNGFRTMPLGYEPSSLPIIPSGAAQNGGPMPAVSRCSAHGQAARGCGARRVWLVIVGVSRPAGPFPRRRRRVRRNCGPRLRNPICPDVPVAIARTAPPFGERAPISEVEALFLDSLNRAQRYIYIETQYLTSRTIADCLAARLRDPKGPEIVMVLHPNSDGWLEQHTMDVLRGRVLQRLRAADQFHRLNLNYPKIPDLHGTMHQHAQQSLHHRR